MANREREKSGPRLATEPRRQLSDHSKLIMEVWGTVGEDFTAEELLQRYNKRYGSLPKLGILGGVKVILKELNQSGLLTGEDGVYRIKQS